MRMARPGNRSAMIFQQTTAPRAVMADKNAANDSTAIAREEVANGPWHASVLE